MREFRVWTGEFMVYPQRRYNLDLVFNKIGEWSLWDTSRQPHELVSERWQGKLMEYSDYKDRDGVEIYEGDIIKTTKSTFKSSGLHIEQCISKETIFFEVDYIQAAFLLRGINTNKNILLNGLFMSKSSDKERIEGSPHYNVPLKPGVFYTFHDFEVVGNIFENPELQQIRDD
jgi:uncharacterized phage protein (TIGR01671 family)